MGRLLFQEEVKMSVGKILIIVVIVIGLYYLMSPYQNCVRANVDVGYCIYNTSW